MKHRNNNLKSNFFYTVLATVFLISCSVSKSKIDFKHTTTSKNIDSILPLNNTSGYILKDSTILRILKHNQ